MKTNRKKLNLDALAVDSFDTSAQAEGQGTVHAHVVDPTEPVEDAPCTCQASCLCHSGYYLCTTSHFTLRSCDYTNNTSCPMD